MNSLVVALCIAILAGECASIPMSRSTYRDSGYHEKSTLTPDGFGIPRVDCESDTSKQSWSPLAYIGPTAVPVLRDDGTIAETPEVAAARAAHFAAVDVIRATNPDTDDGQYDIKKYGDNFYYNSPRTESISKGILVYSSHPMGYYASDLPAVTNQQVKAEVHGTTHPQAKASGTEAALAMWKSNNIGAYSIPGVQNKPHVMNNIAPYAAEVAYSQGHAAMNSVHDMWGMNNAVSDRYYYSTPALQAKPYTSGTTAAKPSEVVYSQGQASANPGIATWNINDAGAVGFSYNPPIIQAKPYTLSTIASDAGMGVYSHGHPSPHPSIATWKINDARTAGFSYNPPVTQAKPYTSTTTASEAGELVYTQGQSSTSPGITTTDATTIRYSYNPPVIQAKPYTSETTAAKANEAVFSQGQATATPSITTNDASTVRYSYNPPVIQENLYTSGTTAAKADEVAYTQGQGISNPGTTANYAVTVGYSAITSAVQNKPDTSDSTGVNSGELAYSQGNTSGESASATWRSNNGASGYIVNGQISQSTPYVSNSIEVGADELAYSKAKASAEAALAVWNAKNVSPVVHTYASPTAQNKPYVGPLATVQLLSNGYLADTPEVIAAKTLHLNALAEAQAASALWKAKHPKTHYNDIWN